MRTKQLTLALASSVDTTKEKNHHAMNRVRLEKISTDSEATYRSILLCRIKAVLHSSIQRGVCSSYAESILFWQTHAAPVSRGPKKNKQISLLKLKAMISHGLSFDWVADHITGTKGNSEIPLSEYHSWVYCIARLGRRNAHRPLTFYIWLLRFPFSVFPRWLVICKITTHSRFFPRQEELGPTTI